MRWPIGRPTTVRARIVALALAPAIALMALWSFAMVSVTGELRALVRLQGVYEDFGTPVDTAVGQIQIERRLAAAYLGVGADHGTAAAAELLEQQRSTDRAVDALRAANRDGDRERLSVRQRQALDAMLDSVDALEGLRGRVLARDVSWDRAVDEYSALVEPGFDVPSALTALQAGQLAREAQVVVELVRVREFVSREDALVAGARAAGTLTDRQYDTLTATIEDRRVFERTYVPDLPSDSRALFTEFQRGSLHRELESGEEALLRAGADGAGEAVAAGSWRNTTDRAVKRYMLLCTRSAKNSAERGREFAYRELTKAVVAGALGLAAVGASLWFAARGARRISRRLETLRDAADLLATRQLPDVMRRLSVGEEVDAVAEAPPLADGEAGSDEIGDVGRSFNTARLAAVEASVKQATLRRGLFAVLLNIARRNQALVHRQLKLVDRLERRTDDPDLLRQLFHVDHLTTRMRRHAESLIILSGAAPGRRWRRPVPIVDVVSSAVGEIEDYARVEVPPMERVGVAADAVADVVHLIAELLENATAFSPPHTRVTLRTGRAGGGFVLEIDDRGLGLDADRAEEAHRTLTGPDDFDPTRHDRLGLYVVGRLAARHGIGVTLCRSPYGGTTAVVLLPTGVLAELDGDPGRGEGTRPTKPASVAAPAEPKTVVAAAAVSGTAMPAGAAPASVAGSAESATPVAAAAVSGTVMPAEAAPLSVAGSVGSDGSVGSATAVVAAAVSETAVPAGAARASVAPPAEPETAVPAAAVSGTVIPAGAAPASVAAPAESATPAQEAPTNAVSATAVSASAMSGEAASATGAAHASGPASASGPAPAESAQEMPVRKAPATAVTPTALPLRALPTRGEARDDTGATGREQGTARVRTPALPTRVRQSSFAAVRRTEGPSADEPPERDLTPEEVRAVFGAFQRGIERGRRGLPAHPDAPSGTAPAQQTDTEDGTDADDAQ
ncbi:nitrate- and nitrite sensing domain-containing protein [Streptomyces sp. NPDC087903]|uniref:sensor histidine kinase n=1 Tax=Streptomyces sp. NPDC087903 TaxID=3365819 RepID=UPI0038014CFC